MCFDIQVYFKALAGAIEEAGKSKVCRVDQQAGDPGELMVKSKD